MNIPGRILGGLFLAAWLITPAQAQAATSPEVLGRVRDTVRSLAFDPSKYFHVEQGSDPSIIRITYTGDDHAWPVYSIAIADGCLPEETPSRGCETQLTARMVRSPAPPGMTRPRQRGSHLVRGLVERRATSRSAIQSNLSMLGTEWLEADLRVCPGVSGLLRRSAQLDWVPEEVSNPGPRDEIVLVVHYDLVEVVFDSSTRQATYRGHISNGSPAAWAVEVAEALEPCWRPARATPPWRR